MSDEILDQEKDALDGLTIAQARSYAKLYNVALSREMTLDDIKAAIKAKQAKHKMVTHADESTGPAPGKWRIKVHKTNEHGAKAGSRPVPVMVNGYKCSIPRNVVVDVPEKVVRVLENSVHYVPIENDSGLWSFEPQLTYPFQVIASTPGADPSPGYEAGRARMYKQRLAYRDEFGYWPKNQAQLREAISNGLIGKPKLPSTEVEA
jgi:hypothetical protein